MYNYIKGKITDLNENTLVVEANGVGYEFTVSASTASELSMKDGEVKVYCYLNVREDEMSLFGFSSSQEKEMFLKLKKVDGVGPKSAITILSGLRVEQLASAVVRGDIKLISSVKGVGKKTAERIVLELKDKVDKEIAESGEELPAIASGKIAVNEEAVMALMTLGFTRAESETAVSKVNPDGLTLEQIIFNALRNA